MYDNDKYEDIFAATSNWGHPRDPAPGRLRLGGKPRPRHWPRALSGCDIHTHAHAQVSFSIV